MTASCALRRNPADALEHAAVIARGVERKGVERDRVKRKVCSALPRRAEPVYSIGTKLALTSEPLST